MKLTLAYLLLLLFFSFSSCDNSDSDPDDLTDLDQLANGEIKQTILSEYMLTEIEGLVFNAITIFKEQRGAANTHETYNFFTIKEICAEMESNTNSQKLILDFGSGCSDSQGNVRRGRIIINYEDRDFPSGTLLQIDLELFQLNQVTINGRINLINRSNGQPHHQKSFLSTFSSLELNYQANDIFLTGQRSIFQVEEYGNNFATSNLFYSTSNDFQLRYKEDDYSISNTLSNSSDLRCWRDQIFLPTVGKMTVSHGNEVQTIDFSTEGCDLAFIYTDSSGESRKLNFNSLLR